jgi:hypothetical protein
VIAGAHGSRITYQWLAQHACMAVYNLGNFCTRWQC